MEAMMEQTPVQQPEADFEAWERELAVDNRIKYLESLPNRGFEPQQRQHLITKLAAIGQPVQNIASLERKQNRKEDNTENVLASYGSDGAMAAYELMDTQVPEKQLGTTAHELAHANSPMNEDNAPLFGGEAQRQKAETFVLMSAQQALISNKFLNAYHAWLAKELAEGRKSFGYFVEETQAILTELGLTNRAKLEQVEAAQHAKIANLQKAGQLTKDFEPVKLISHNNNRGEVQVEGIDNQLIDLTEGVSDHKSLMEHIGGLKAQFYPDKSLAIANKRKEGPPKFTEVQARSIASLLLEDQLALSA